MQSTLNNLGITAIKIFFVAMLFTAGACKDGNTTPQEATSDTAVNASKMDIHSAVISGNIEVLKQHLLAGTDINTKDPGGGSSPLISACLFGKTAMAKMLIEYGADLNFRNNDGSTALHTAAFFCRPEIVSMLLERGADKTIKNRYGQTAYETVAGPFADVKNIYDVLGSMLAPMGLKLDYAYIEKTRPEVAVMLK